MPKTTIQNEQQHDQKQAIVDAKKENMMLKAHETFENLIY